MTVMRKKEMKGQFFTGILIFGMMLFASSYPAFAKLGMEQYYTGIEQCNSTDPDTAIRGCSSAILVWPQSGGDKQVLAALHNTRGFAYEQKADHDRAIWDYSRAIELNPTFSKAFSNRGVAYRQKGEFDQAIRDFNSAIRINPNNAAALDNRGAIWIEKGEFDKARDDLNRSISLDPRNPKAYSNRGAMYLNLCKYDLAIRDYDHALRLQPGFANAKQGREKALRKEGGDPLVCGLAK
jgi:Flp pilus assembly protein TadD